LLLLLFTGIHNAWDVVTFLAFRQAERSNGQDEKPTAQESDDTAVVAEHEEITDEAQSGETVDTAQREP
jgi:hypothetical protein